MNIAWLVAIVVELLAMDCCDASEQAVFELV